MGVAPDSPLLANHTPDFGVAPLSKIGPAIRKGGRELASSHRFLGQEKK